MEDVWEKVKAAIRERVPAHTYKMWIEPMGFVRSREDAIVLSCPNFFFKKRVVEHYNTLIESEFSRILLKSCKLSLEISEKKEAPKKRKSKKNILDIPDPQLALPEAASQSAGSGRILRREFTFDRFVVGNNNDFAYSAALSVASKRDSSQSSLYLLSDTGMGKSHLSQAVGHHILSEFPTESVYYVTAEDFTNEMVNAIRGGTIETFKEKYRNRCDVLLLEDIHFLAGKERTQIELGMALDYLFNADKKIIFTSCYLPSDIPKMNDQLKSRLSASLISNIEAPDFETRLKILSRKSKENKIKLPKNVLDYLAGELSENVRQLESGLIGVAAKSALMGSSVDMSLARSVVKNIANQTRAITIDLIKEVICSHYNISLKDMISNSRKQAIVRPRQIAIYLARRYTNQPLQIIGKNFNRYHATAIHSISAVEQGVRQDPAIQKQIQLLCEKIESPNPLPLP